MWIVKRLGSIVLLAILYIINQSFFFFKIKSPKIFNHKFVVKDYRIIWCIIYYLKFELLKKSYPNSTIPEYTIHSDYRDMKKIIDCGIYDKLILKKYYMNSIILNFENPILYGYGIKK